MNDNRIEDPRCVIKEGAEGAAVWWDMQLFFILFINVIKICSGTSSICITT